MRRPSTGQEMAKVLAAGHASSGPTGWHPSLQTSSSRTKEVISCLWATGAEVQHDSEEGPVTTSTAWGLASCCPEAPSWRSLLWAACEPPALPGQPRITHKPVRVPLLRQGPLLTQRKTDPWCKHVSYSSQLPESLYHILYSHSPKPRRALPTHMLNRK